MRRSNLITTFGFACLLPAFALAQQADDSNHDVIQVKVPEVPDTGPRPDLGPVATAIVEQTNSFRKAEKRPPVEANDKLTETAQSFAKYMAQTDKYGHTADGNRPSERAKTHGYDYCIVLENIAYAYDSRGFTAEKLTDQFVTGWKESPGHRKNMLDPDATQTGVAVARSEKTGHYYAVQMFGRPKSAAIEFRIENRAGETVQYTLGDTPYALQPRYTRTHTLCRPAELTFRWPGEKVEPTTLTPATADDFVVTLDGTQYTVRKK